MASVLGYAVAPDDTSVAGTVASLFFEARQMWAQWPPSLQVWHLPL